VDQVYVKIEAIIERLDLLEEMQYKVSFEQFASSWSSFGFPLELRHTAAETTLYLETKEKFFADE